jgi:hypothetical protein
VLWKSQILDVQAKQATPVVVKPADGRVPVYQPVALVAHRSIAGALVDIRVALPLKRTHVGVE